MIVEAVEKFEFEDDAYNLEIDGDPTYFANGVLVHNCRFLDGKYILVSGSLDLLDRLSASAKPEDVKAINPWMSKGRDDRGSFLQIKKPDGSVTQVARIVRSGVGNVDDIGEFLDELRMDQLETLGIGPPPYHGNCRSTIVPVLD